MSRRSFLWTTLALSTSGAVLLSSCGGDDDDATDAGPDAATGGPDGAATTGAMGTGAGPAGGGLGREGVTSEEQAQLPLTVLIASADLAVGSNRLAFGVLDKATSSRFDPAQPLRVGLTPPVGTGATRIPPPASYVDAPFHGDGLEADTANSLAVEHGVYVTTAAFDRPGPDNDPWWVWVESGDQRGVSPVAVAEVHAVLTAGQPAPQAASPTPTDTLGVDPICTRDPVCSLHDVSLADVIGTRPVVVSFSTPARCTSRLCGPSLELVLEQVPEFQDRVAFVHVEIYRNNQTTDLISTVTDWGLPTEPWLFAVGADGNVVARLDSAFDRPEVRALVEAAAATA
jgi:hypothetical protein